MIENNSPKTILIAMTGGVESTVGAYLLKKQGHKCIGIGLQLFKDGDEMGPFQDIVVSDLTKVKNICSYLDIPFYAVDASDLFADLVLDPLVGRVLSGHTFEPLVYLNYVLVEILLQKAKKFNTTHIATTHYAKVLKNQKNGAHELMVANDLENDQSYFLSRLEQRHLKQLILPLSEIRKKEVQKIGELIKVDYIQRIKNKHRNIMHDPRMVDLVEDRSPKDLRRLGSLYDYQKETSICEHLGIHHYFVGKNNLTIKEDLRIDPLLQVISIIPYKGNIFIDYPDRLKFKHVLTIHFLAAEHLDITMPLNVFVKVDFQSEKIPCTLFVKNNNVCLIDFDDEQSGQLVPGQVLVFYNRAGEKGKVLGSAIVEVAGVFEDGEYNTLPKNKKETDEENNTKRSPKNDSERLRF